MKRLLPLFLVIALAACGEQAAPPAPAAAEAPAAAPAAAVETPAAPTEDTASEPAATTDADSAATDAAPADAAAPAEAAAEAPAPVATAELPPLDPAKAPRRGIDYEVLAQPQPTMGQGGVEVAEVFAYTCIHCANLQPMVNEWKKTLPADVRLVYVPGVFGGISDNFARGFYAAESMGLLDATHDDLFKAVLIERKFQTADAEEIAGWYATKGADRATFLSTMQSFAVTTKLNRARQFALRGGVDSTPTMIVNGKYRATAARDRGLQGLLDTVDWIVAHERAGKPMP